jgi:putative endonuclease
MSDDLRHKLGSAGEQFAADHLRRLGLRIEARNVRTRFGEIDIIATDARTVVFCEVKTRRASRSADPFSGFRLEQQRRVRAMAVAWLAEASASVRRQDLRFDAIGILIDGQGALVALEHLEGCF